MRAVASALLVLVVGCGARSVPFGEELPRDNDARFVGLWAVESSLRHLYLGSLYNFSANGELHHLRDSAWQNGDEQEVGYLVHVVVEVGCMATGMGCPVDVECSFGAQWWSLDDATLAVSLECDDGIAREATFLFTTEAGHNVDGANVTLVEVDGRDGWYLPYSGVTDQPTASWRAVG